MSWWIRTRSLAYRLRDSGRVVAEDFGPLHQDRAMLEWGSITKTVTAAIAARLDQAGALQLSTPVVEYLPESHLPQSVDTLSLVTHTSGLPTVPTGIATTLADVRDPYAKYTTEYFDTVVLPALADQRHGEVGSFSYSNLGYAVLTRLLEVVTGRDWWDLARHEVFGPFGITDVSLHPDPHTIPKLRTWTGRIRTQWRDSGPFVGAGGVHGTFAALEQYALAIARLEPGTMPLGWMEDPTLWWHNGHTRDHGTFVGFSHDGARVITAHTLGCNAGRADRAATDLERRHPRGAGS